LEKISGSGINIPDPQHTAFSEVNPENMTGPCGGEQAGEADLVLHRDPLCQTSAGSSQVIINYKGWKKIFPYASRYFLSWKTKQIFNSWKLHEKIFALKFRSLSEKLFFQISTLFFICFLGNNSALFVR
jgi:hypothetical protein